MKTQWIGRAVALGALGLAVAIGVGPGQPGAAAPVHQAGKVLGDITAVITPAKSGLTGGATEGDVTLGVDKTVMQARVNATCAATTGGIGTINADGTVGCLGADWQLAGNAGTDPATNFLGTTDNKTLNLRVNNEVGWRLQPTTACNPVPCTPNVIGGFSGNIVDTSGVEGATIAGGGHGLGNSANSVTENFGTVGGGLDNTASGPAATVGGGLGNTASRPTATVGGGQTNTASGLHATVPGGQLNSAAGLDSFAAGRQARANHDGAFVWADSIGGDFTSDSLGRDSFHARATGGVRFVTGVDGSGNPATGVQLPQGGGAWSSLSDRALKEHLAPVDARAVLDALARVPISTWNLISQDPSVRHLGPMAQDFFAAFGLGEDDRRISTVDADGVAFAAIQGLYGVVQEQEAQLAEQRERLAAQDARLAGLAAQNAALEARLVALEGAAASGTGPAVSSSLPAAWPLLGGLLLAGLALRRRG